jgi:hypothetical protein
MSSERFNFNDDVSDAFQFEINGLAYDMRYPTQDEIRPFVKLVTQFEAIKNTASDEQIEKVNAKMEDFIHGLITPVGHETPIKETLKKVNIVVLRRLNERLIKELVS